MNGTVFYICIYDPHCRCVATCGDSEKAKLIKYYRKYNPGKKVEVLELADYAEKTAKIKSMRHTSLKGA